MYINYKPDILQKKNTNLTIIEIIIGLILTLCAFLGKAIDKSVPNFWIGLIIIAISCIVISIIRCAYCIISNKKISAHNTEEMLLKQQYDKLDQQITDYINVSKNFSLYDYVIECKSAAGTKSLDGIKFFKEHPQLLNIAIETILEKQKAISKWKEFLDDNPFKDEPLYSNFEKVILSKINSTKPEYIVYSHYVSPAGRSRDDCYHSIKLEFIQNLVNDPTTFMSAREKAAYLKEQSISQIKDTQKLCYDQINNLIDTINEIKENLIDKSDEPKLDEAVSLLYDKAVSTTQKIKSINAPELSVITKILQTVKSTVNQIYSKNKKILDYYLSEDFKTLKQTCESLNSSQIEFNQYIDEKAESITKMFGTVSTREETIYEDQNNYVRPYKKSIDAFTAEVSAAVFASAENNPINYVIKYFYPSKNKYPEQIQKLQTLIEELETLKEAKIIIDKHKQEYQQYLTNVPDYILQYDLDGFYSKLGFANLSESRLTVAYKFSYTSNGGLAQRSFTVPMTEDTIIKIIEILQNKLTYNDFTKEQRRLMTGKLRKQIKERDNYTCCHCGNSIWKEPNLLLEVDHIIPVADGGYTVEDNLQTLCWVCNRHKSKRSNEDMKIANTNRQSIQAQVLAENIKNNQ